MARPKLYDRYMEQLLEGRRSECRELVWGVLERGTDAHKVYFDLLWPAMEQVDRLYRDDRINKACEHMATRINRIIADQVQRQLICSEGNGKRLLITCADQENEELGAQMCADLFEANGWEVYFLGGGVPCDEILELVGKLRPTLLLVFGTTPQGVPGVRALVDMIRDVGVNPSMNIMVSGGVFNRAADLWEEIRADLFAPSAKEALRIAEEAEPRVPDWHTSGKTKKRRRRRRPPLLEEMERQRR